MIRKITIRHASGIALIAALALPSAAGAADDPSLESCIRYAEADHTKETALKAAYKTYREIAGPVEVTLREAMAENHAQFTAARRAADATYNREMLEPQRVLKRTYADARALKETTQRTALARWNADEIDTGTYNLTDYRAETEWRETLRRADAAYDAAETRLLDKRGETINAAADVNKTQNAEARAAHDATLREPKAQRLATEQAAEAAWTKTYHEIFDDAATPRSEVPEVLAQLRARHRALCRQRHQM